MMDRGDWQALFWVAILALGFGAFMVLRDDHQLNSGGTTGGTMYGAEVHESPGLRASPGLTQKDYK